MALAINNSVMAIAMDCPQGSDLQQIADNRGWQLLESTPLRKMMKQVVTDQPRVIVLQVAQATDKALQLIRMVQTDWRRVPLVVMAIEHNDNFERAARIAGATCYLPGETSLQEVNKYVDNLLEPGHDTNSDNYTGSQSDHFLSPITGQSPTSKSTAD